MCKWKQPANVRNTMDRIEWLVGSHQIPEGSDSRAELYILPRIFSSLLCFFHLRVIPRQKLGKVCSPRAALWSQRGSGVRCADVRLLLLAGRFGLKPTLSSRCWFIDPSRLRPWQPLDFDRTAFSSSGSSVSAGVASVC